MINLSSAMGGQFAWSAAELTEEIRQMGPSPLRNTDSRLQDEQALLELQHHKGTTSGV
jgi:hypothetical protein